MSPELAESFGLAKGRGVIISGVLQNGPAAQAGLRPGDVIVSIDNRPVNSVPALLSTVAALKPGQSAQVGVLRREGETTIQVTAGRRNIARANGSR